MPAATHGATRGRKPTPEYSSWAAMKKRCLNPRNSRYREYGGRGITVCQRWIASFEAFLEDMGKKPTARHSIERRDVNLGYFPDNCYWAVQKTQMRNTRRSHRITAHGETKTLVEWSEITGVNRTTIAWRISHGMSPEEAMAR